jgi:hypothetical protein
MVTLGENDNMVSGMIKDRHVELGSNLHRAESMKDRWEGIEQEYGKMKGNGGENRNNLTTIDKPQNIIILVHGYQASRQDFQVLKLCL